jgi:hypothetical protein
MNHINAHSDLLIGVQRIINLANLWEDGLRLYADFTAIRFDVIVESDNRLSAPSAGRIGAGNTLDWRGMPSSFLAS